MPVEFHDYSMKCKAAIGDKGKIWLTEGSAELASQAATNSPVDTGQLKGSWSTVVGDTSAQVGSTAEHSIWNEFGTGEYAAGAGGGRRGGWAYKDEHGKWHFTYGMKPRRMLYKAYRTKKAALINRARQLFREI